MDIVILAAVAENGVIGRGNALPWRLKSDMKHFRAFTMGKPVVMGRKTYLSIGKPLTGRTTIVVSRDRRVSPRRVVVVAPNLDAALAAARGDALRRNAAAIVIAGGAEIYAQALPLATRLAITDVHKRVEGDAAFPPSIRQIWRESARNDKSRPPRTKLPFAFVTYERVRMEPLATPRPTDAHNCAL